MNGKDEKIEYELQRLSQSQLPPEDKILGKARAEMRRRKDAKPASKKVKTGWVIGLCSFAAAVAIVLIIGVSSLGGSVPGAPDGDNSAMPAPPQHEDVLGGYYSASELTARKISHAQASALYNECTGKEFPLPSDGELDDGTAVMNVTVTAFKSKNSGQDMLLQCKMRCYNGGSYDDVTVWFELTNNVYEGNKNYLNLNNGNVVKFEQARENGEYVSHAYLKNKYGCMLSVMNPGEYNLNYYLELLFGISEEGAR